MEQCKKPVRVVCEPYLQPRQLTTETDVDLSQRDSALWDTGSTRVLRLQLIPYGLCGNCSTCLELLNSSPEKLERLGAIFISRNAYKSHDLSRSTGMRKLILEVSETKGP